METGYTFSWVAESKLANHKAWVVLANANQTYCVAFYSCMPQHLETGLRHSIGQSAGGNSVNESCSDLCVDCNL